LYIKTAGELREKIMKSQIYTLNDHGQLVPEIEIPATPLAVGQIITYEEPDKNALLADREKLSAEQLTAAGIQFCQDEQFYIRPKLETAADTKEVKS